jgi:phage gpG-like protein
MSKFTIKIESNAAEIVRGFKEWPRVMAQSVASAMDRENQFTIGHITRTKLSQRGPKTLGVVSGRLRGSVRATAALASTFSVTSQIGTNVKYAAVHEFGSRPYVIRPKTARFLRFATPRGVVFARQVNHPGLPARAMFSTGIEERSENYSTALAAAIEEAWSK